MFRGAPASTRRAGRRTASAAVAGLAVLALAACAPATADAPEASDAGPLTIDNCGFEASFDAAPERVLAIKSTSIEMLLALGLEDRIVGTAFSDGPAAEEWADAAAKLPVVSDKVPGQEATLELEPDLVYAGWESNLSAEGAGERADLADLGIASYVSPAACQEEGYQPDPFTWEHLWDEIGEVGSIFDADDAADGLVERLQGELDAIRPDDRGLSALWFSSGTDSAFVGAGIGAPQLIMDSAGLENVAADEHDTWTGYSWEAVADANPDVIILIDSAWGTTERKIGQLESNPATAALPAVQEGRYLVLPFPTGEAGVRNVEAVASLVDQLGELDLG
ncbi:putative F420-0 ABC transporter substrate-binding protein [Agromyces archimandritae]|uniref:F420-0 ABC transporter substrate-binding protein n=1 Tax=Agromyces archimandritae TaxID=2781962 RepID=A0A975FPZ4_9MICO|nr:putative F420-0 ABC transporter substrate-binding protein [Agromyces archimandritae]QTX05892.1 putative F420-0 ABC transporter substrate-binding protein [Agromyces archimandritae]